MNWRSVWKTSEDGPTRLPLIFLFYLVFCFIYPAQSHASWDKWAATGAGILCFLALYLISYFKRGRIGQWTLAGIVILACALAPVNPGIFGFFIYAAALAGFRFDARTAYAVVGGLLALVTLEGWMLHTGLWMWLYIFPIVAIVGVSNIHLAAKKRADVKLRLAHEEIEHLAKVAERERIARDLHDVLGHTLSVVVLKAELAAKLAEHDRPRAQREMNEVEQIAREALMEVRHAIRGYRARGLGEELTRAKATLETAGVRAECEAPDLPAMAGRMSAAQETVLALVVRESVTNVVRHAQAAVCRIRLERTETSYRLEVSDDGCGGFEQEGNGLRGMRERVEALNGGMTRDTSQGTRLTITIPLRSKQEAIA
jgi:two-component system, NarL family, sensor histidine kinase DesK